MPSKIQISEVIVMVFKLKPQYYHPIQIFRFYLHYFFMRIYKAKNMKNLNPIICSNLEQASIIPAVLNGSFECDCARLRWVISGFGMEQFMSINNLMMSSQTHRNQIQQLSSLSLSQNLREVRDSQVFPSAARKCSFDLVNLLGDSHLFNRSKLERSLDMLNSSIGYNKQPPHASLALTEEDRARLALTGVIPAQIERIQSDEDEPEDEQQGQEVAGKQEKQQSEQERLQFEVGEQAENYMMNEMLPEDLAMLLMEKQIPLEYVRGLVLVREQREIKSVRRLKVERYLEKRRKKTWNKKICYNCRQKVAEQRLRIKGKFIKKRRALQILGLSTPLSTSEVKRLLEEMLKDKTLKEIEELIHREE